MTPPLLCCCPVWLCHLGQGFTNIDHEQKSLPQSLYCNIGQPCVYGSTARACTLVYSYAVSNAYTHADRKHFDMLSGGELG